LIVIVSDPFGKLIYRTGRRWVSKQIHTKKDKVELRGTPGKMRNASLSLGFSLLSTITWGAVPASFYIRFNFHEVFPFIEIDCGKEYRLSIQAKKECEIAGRGTFFRAQKHGL
jgi:hypothetical protein